MGWAIFLTKKFLQCWSPFHWEPLSVKHENSHWSVDIVHPESSANIMQNIVGAKLQIKLSTKPHLDYNKPLLMLQAEYTQECQKGGGVLGREWEKVSEWERESKCVVSERDRAKRRCKNRSYLTSHVWRPYLAVYTWVGCLKTSIWLAFEQTIPRKGCVGTLVCMGEGWGMHAWLYVYKPGWQCMDIIRENTGYSIRVSTHGDRTCTKIQEICRN